MEVVTMIAEEHTMISRMVEKHANGYSFRLQAENGFEFLHAG